MIKKFRRKKMNDNFSHRNNRILIIDDNRMIHNDFREILCNPREVGGDMGEIEKLLFEEDETAIITYDVDSAYQGEEGVKLAHEALHAGKPYAMAFVDVRIPPGIDGVETVKRIWGGYPDLEVVFCTAFSDYTWVEMLRELVPTDRFLIMKKPFDSVVARQLAHGLTEKWNIRQSLLSRTRDLENMVKGKTGELLQAKEAAETIDREKEVFLTETGRELHAFLREVINCSELLLATDLTEEQINYIKTMKRDGEKLFPVVAGILKFS